MVVRQRQLFLSTTSEVWHITENVAIFPRFTVFLLLPMYIPMS